MDTELTITSDHQKPVKQKTLIKRLSVPNHGYTSLVNKHRRAGSTGTTGDESNTTDDDEPDCSMNSSYEHVNIVRNGMYTYEDDTTGNQDDVSINSDLSHDDTCDINRTSSKQFTKSRIDKKNVEHIRNKIHQLVDDRSQEIVLENGEKDKISWETLSSGSDSTKDFTEIESKEVTLSRLQEELDNAHRELRLRDEEVSRLSRIRTDVETELEDLTASLFQEAHTMVRAANISQAAAEKSLRESEMKVDVLTAEVAALKTLVLTSTPSCPNPHLHPQISARAGKDETGSSVFSKKHHRSPSHFNLKYGRENSPPESPVKEQRAASSLGNDILNSKDGYEVDPNLHKEFLTWKENPKIDKSNPFINRLYREDIDLCLEFNNTELSSKIADAINSGNIFIEAVSDKTKTLFPKKCALLEVPRLCCYRMKLGDQDEVYNISQICRNRIIAVCDFLNYLRYIERGLVKSSAHEVYWEMIRLRKEMVTARLGMPLST